MSQPTFSVGSLSVYDGDTGTVEITYTMDTYEASKSTDFNLLCGARLFTVRDNSDNSLVGNWAKITGHSTIEAKKILTIDPSLYGALITSDITTTLKIDVTYVDYPNRAGNSNALAVTLRPITCNCGSMIWVPPAPVQIQVAVDATGTGVAPKPTSDDSLAADE